jgi:cell wall-associated NlpC family hydrolase
MRINVFAAAAPLWRARLCGHLGRVLPCALLAVAAFAQPAPVPAAGQERPAAKNLGVVARPVVNMFSHASADSDVVSQAIYATIVSTLQSRAGWTEIRTPDDYTGWVESAALRPLPAGASYPATSSVAQVESLTAHLYREPDVTKHAPRLTLPFDVRLEVTQDDPKDPRWLCVRLVDGVSAWIQRGDVSLAPAGAPRVSSIPELVALSQRFLGLPYTWGGSSAYGYDCSGFTQMLCRRGGVLLPRDADVQAAWSGMTKIDRAALQPGDLLYFGKDAAHITHTGFYLGDGRFIHSTTHAVPVIQISRLDDAPWTTLLVACRRWRR